MWQKKGSSFKKYKTKEQLKAEASQSIQSRHRFIILKKNHFQNLFFQSHLVECFSIVNSNNAAYHLGHDNHIAQMSLDNCWFF